MKTTKPVHRVTQAPNGRPIPRMIFNDDSDILRMVPPPHTLESLAVALDYLKGTPVDCLCWCVGEQQMAYSYASKVWESTFDRLAQNADSPGAAASAERNAMYSLHRQGIDYLPHLIQRAHEQGLLFAASFRMNDTHLKSSPNSWLAPEFWRTHQQYRLWDATDAKSYYNAALDYSFPEVRNPYRAAIAEVVERYDVDSIELDFTRSPYFFQPSEAWDKREILTAFVREIRNLLDRVGAERKRPLTLILRVDSVARALKTAGIDLRQWIAERLAHILIISEEQNNCNQDIGPWLNRCREAGVLLYPAVEKDPAANTAPEFHSIQMRNPQGPRHDGHVRRTLEESLCMKRAAAQNLLAQKPDGLATFNFQRATESTTALLKEMSSLETLAGTKKIFTFYKDLPIYIEANRPRRYHQTIPFTIRGEDVRDATVTLRWRWIAERNPHAIGAFRQNPIVKPGVIKVYLNDLEIPESDVKKVKVRAERIPSGFKLKSHQIVEIQIAGTELRDGENTLAFEMLKPPHARDPYVYIYNFEVEVTFA